MIGRLLQRCYHPPYRIPFDKQSRLIAPSRSSSYHYSTARIWSISQPQSTIRLHYNTHFTPSRRWYIDSQQQDHINTIQPQPVQQSSSSSSSRSRPRWIRTRVVLLSLAGVSVLLMIIRGPSEIQSDIHIISRFLRATTTFIITLIDFKWTWYRHPQDTPEYREQTDALHKRTAERLLSLALHNRGLYVKTGQYLCSMNHALPPIYITTLKPLQDQAPTMGMDDVRLLISTDFPGQSIESLYALFDPIPVASASIAQVHHAYLHDGSEVAVKLQYPSLQKEFAVDLFAHYCVLSATELFFPAFPLKWMHDELQEHLTQELDFIHEGQNAERAMRNYKETGNTQIYIPSIYWSHTTKRILTMEWVDGVKITDRVGLHRIGVSIKDACYATINGLAEQIFLHGFVHCDPHPGNIFIRRTPSSNISSSSNNNTSLSSPSFQVLLLDWGLVRQMRESVRIHYCELWEALVLHDDNRVKEIVRTLGVEDEGNSWEVIAMSILMRPYGASTIGMANKLSKQDLDALRSSMEQQVQRWIISFQSLPRELLLILRNQNYLRALNYELGMPINRFRLMARMAIKGKDYRNTTEEVTNMTERQWNYQMSNDKEQHRLLIEELNMVHNINVRSSIGHWLHVLNFEWHLLSADLIYWLGSLWMRYFINTEIKQQIEKATTEIGEPGNTLLGG